MPPPYELLKVNRAEYLQLALAKFPWAAPGAQPLSIETVWYQDWTLEQIQKANESRWWDSTGVYFFSDYCTEVSPKGEYLDKRFSFIQRIGLAKDRPFWQRLRDYSHIVESTMGRGNAWSAKSNWGFRYAQLDVIRIHPQETERLEKHFLRTVATFQNYRDVPKQMVYQPIIFDSELNVETTPHKGQSR